MRKGLLVLLISLFFPLAWAAEARLLSGPMVGHTTAESARIWFETDRPAEVRILYWQEPRLQYRHSLGEPLVRGETHTRTSAEAPHIGLIQLDNLKPGWLIYYELELDGILLRPDTPQVFSLMPGEPGDPSEGSSADFSVAFASCTYPARVPVQPIWAQISSYRPSALLLIGDNNYMPNRPEAYETDEDTVAFVMARYHRFLRDMPGLRSLLSTTPTYAIWDDHDYGPDNSDRNFKWKELSLSLFKRYYPNPTAGLADTPGIFTKFRISDAEFFLLDDRYHRDSNTAPDRKTMFGGAQVRWLKQGLEDSSATFKVIVNGNSMLVDRRGSGESWSNFGRERDEFIQWLFDRGITGVLFVAGDWHVGTLSRLHRPEDDYPLYELLSSNSGVTPAPDSTDIGQGHYRFHQFVGPEYLGFNFGLLSFSGDRDQRMVSLQIVDGAGKARIGLTLRQADLTPGWKNGGATR